MNRLLFPDDTRAPMLWTPPDVVGRSEHVQIEERLAGFLENVKVCAEASPTG
jgi:tRNA A64-2'-O-ribosylphosphate transferase